jgi:peptidoglycan/xylan/chitin deacetylase (PgdA/CDA1 family)
MRLLESLLVRARVAWWGRKNDDFLIVLNWHQVSPAFDPELHHKYTWTPLAAFETAVDHLSSRFQIVALHEAITRISRGHLRGPCAALTFDDGDVTIPEHVVPVLRGRGVPAMFFINTAYLDGQRSYWFPILSYLSGREDIRRRAGVTDELMGQALNLRQTRDPRVYNDVRERVERLAPLVPNLTSRLVSEDWLETLDGDQFAIGAHGHEHQRFSMMPPEWQRKDLSENLRILARFRAFRPIFAVPFGRTGDWNKETIRISQDLGLEIVLADGGMNIAPAEYYRRNPSDGRAIGQVLAAAMANWDSI